MRFQLHLSQWSPLVAQGGIGVNDPRLAWSQSLNTEDSREDKNTEDSREDNRDWHCQATKVCER